MKQRISVSEAARLMGVSQQFIRVGMQSGKLPIGEAVQVTGRRWTYYISPKRFEKFTGIKMPPAATGGVLGDSQAERTR